MFRPSLCAFAKMTLGLLDYQHPFTSPTQLRAFFLVSVKAAFHKEALTEQSAMVF
jgi:hypothetical protein